MIPMEYLWIIKRMTLVKQPKLSSQVPREQKSTTMSATEDDCVFHLYCLLCRNNAWLKKFIV